MAYNAGAPRVRSLNVAAPEAEARPVLVPGGNKARSGSANARKPSQKPVRKVKTGTPEKALPAGAKKEEGAKRNVASEVGGGSGCVAKGMSPLPSPRRTPPGKAVATGAKEESSKRNAAGESGGGAAKGMSPLPSPRRTPPGPLPRKSDGSPQPSISLNISSSESKRARASTGRVERSRSGRTIAPKHGKVTVKAATAEVVALATPVNAELEGKKRCAWVTPTTGELPVFLTVFDIFPKKTIQHLPCQYQ
jgi:DNA-3-methyladenine glycosylase I